MGKYMRAFCLGNGPSRKSFDLEILKTFGTVIGCNAIYRDFTPDILVANDSKMSHLIYRSGYPLKNKTYLSDWTPIPRIVAQTMVDGLATDGDDVVYHHADGVDYVTEVKEDMVTSISPHIDNFSYATGTRSIYLACELGAKEVYIIGHDLYDLNDTIENIYTGTEGYADKLIKRDSNIEYDWTKQHKNTFDTFPNTKFYKADLNISEIKEWENCKNLEYISFYELRNLRKYFGSRP